MNQNIPKDQSDKNKLAAFILKKNNKNNKSNSSHKYFKFKANVYSIAERISYLDVTNTHKLTLLNYLEKTLKRFGNLPGSQIKKSFIRKFKNNSNLAESFKNEYIKFKAKMNAFRDVNSRLISSNQFTTRPVERGFESVNWDKSKEVNNLMKSAQIEADFSGSDKFKKL